MEIPMDMKYFLKRLAFNRVPTRFSPLSSTNAGLGDTISVRLPSNVLLDVSTLAMFFKNTLATTEGSKFAGFGMGSHSIVRSLQISVGGNVILHLNEYGKVFSALHFLTSSQDSDKSKSILTYGTNISTTLPATADFANEMAILEFYGLSGIQPSILDTSLLNDVQMHITLHSDYRQAGGLATASPGALGSYSMSLSNIHFMVDIIQVDDLYRQILRESMESMSLELLVPNYFIYTSNSANGAHSSVFTVGSQSLDSLVLIPTSTVNSLGVAITNDNSTYIPQIPAQFRGTDISTVSVDVNGQSVLSSLTQEEVFYSQLKCWGNQVGGRGGSLMGSLIRSNATADGHTATHRADFVGTSFLPCCRFNEGSDSRTISGLNGKAVGGIQVSVTTVDAGVGSTAQSLTTVALCSSTLAVGSGGQISFTS